MLNKNLINFILLIALVLSGVAVKSFASDIYTCTAPNNVMRSASLTFNNNAACIKAEKGAQTCCAFIDKKKKIAEGIASDLLANALTNPAEVAGIAVVLNEVNACAKTLKSLKC